MSTIGIILAAGSSKRFLMNFNKVKKQYSLLYNTPLLTYSIDNFLKNKNISKILIVISKGDERFYEMCTIGKQKILPFVYGGSSRQESILKALASLESYNPKKVLIHDGSRPFASQRIINEEVQLLDSYDGVVPTLPISDSVKIIKDLDKISSVSRNNLHKTQTPQAFLYKKYYEINKKLENNIDRFTDDISLCENEGLKIALIKGDETNIKITNSDDIINIENTFPSSKTFITKVGIGYDIHRLNKVDYADNYITLGGLKVNSEYKIEAHSDGDVLIHSIVDAILGTLSIGDIGCHFSDKDNINKNRKSEDFLIFAKNALIKHSGFINNIDVTIVCEKPKISKFRKDISTNISKILEITEEKINIKSTTNEKLDSIGNLNGICVYSLASVSFEQ